MDYSKEMKELFLMQQIFGTLFSVTNKVQAKGDNFLKTLTSRQLMIMISIIHLPNEDTSLKNIAKMMETSKQNANRLISGLKKKGYLEIIPSKRDGREINVRITKLGKQVMLECGEKSLLLFADIFNDFSEEELDTFWKLLKKMYSFDGEKHDKFEENVVIEADENTEEWQTEVFMKFVERRRKREIPRKISQ